MIETPSLSRFYCPGCEPEADPSRDILEVHRCWRHPALDAGSEDASVTTSAPTSTEAGGESNRLWCEFFHRDARK